jgi:hypothetical protein
LTKLKKHSSLFILCINAQEKKVLWHWHHVKESLLHSVHNDSIGSTGSIGGKGRHHPFVVSDEAVLMVGTLEEYELQKYLT